MYPFQYRSSGFQDFETLLRRQWPFRAFCLAKWIQLKSISIDYVLNNSIWNIVKLTSKVTSTANINGFPDDVIGFIASHLQCRQYFRLSMANKHIHSVCHNPVTVQKFQIGRMERHHDSKLHRSFELSSYL